MTNTYHHGSVFFCSVCYHFLACFCLISFGCLLCLILLLHSSCGGKATTFEWGEQNTNVVCNQTIEVCICSHPKHKNDNQTPGGKCPSMRCRQPNRLHLLHMRLHLKNQAGWRWTCNATTIANCNQTRPKCLGHLQILKTTVGVKIGGSWVGGPELCV